MPSPEEQQTIRDICGPLRAPVVVELGAHTGEDEGWIRAAFQEPVHYVMVEPDPHNQQAILDRVTRADLRISYSPVEKDRQFYAGNYSIYGYSAALGTRRLYLGAVADQDGMREFHFSVNQKTGHRTSGSLRAPTGHLVHFPEIAFPYKGMVCCYTLDWIFQRESLSKIDLLWVDIQGAENMMIAGGREALQHTRYLFMEVESVELYKDEALKCDLIDMLPGWEVAKEFPYNILMQNQNFRERGAR